MNLEVVNSKFHLFLIFSMRCKGIKTECYGTQEKTWPAKLEENVIKGFPFLHSAGCYCRFSLSVIIGSENLDLRLYINTNTI